MNPAEHPKPTQVSIEVAEALFDCLDYFSEYLPSIYGMSRAAWEITDEGKRTMAALRAFVEETGIQRTYPLT